MTCIAAIVNPETQKSWIGGDSCGTRGDMRDQFVSPKIWAREWKGRKLLFGASGRSRFQQMVEFCVPLPDEEFDEQTESLRAFLIRTWIPEIQRYVLRQQFGDIASQMILTYKGQIYVMDSCLTLTQMEPTHYAIGSGGGFAHGVLWHMDHEKCALLPEKRIRTAIEGAMQHCTGTGGRVDILSA